MRWLELAIRTVQRLTDKGFMQTRREVKVKILDRLPALVFGFRRDLDLASRWWHRLAKVALVLLLLTGAMFTFFIAAQSVWPSATIRNATVITTLRDYLSKSDPSVVNVVPAFLAIKGELGQISGPSIEYVNSYDVGRMICSADAYKNIDEFVALMNDGATTDADRTTKEEAIRDLRAARIDGPACYTPTDVTLPEPRLIVKYTLTLAAKAGAYAKAGGVSGLVALGLMLVLSNLYYRAFIYILFGPRRAQSSVINPPIESREP